MDGQAKLILTSNGKDVACVESSLSNGHTASVKGVAWASAGIAAGALALSGLSALGSAGSTGAPSSSPSAGDVMGWFGSVATNGTCGAGVGFVNLYGATDCTGGGNTANTNASQCLGGTYRSAKAVAFSQVNPTCSGFPTSNVTGAAQLTNPITVCCN